VSIGTPVILSTDTWLVKSRTPTFIGSMQNSVTMVTHVINYGNSTVNRSVTQSIDQSMDWSVKNRRKCNIHIYGGYLVYLNMC